MLADVFIFFGLSLQFYIFLQPKCYLFLQPHVNQVSPYCSDRRTFVMVAKPLFRSYLKPICLFWRPNFQLMLYSVNCNAVLMSYNAVL